MPISTPAVISRDLGVPTIYFDPTAKISKSDPALMEIKLINSKADLNQWLVHITTKQMEN